MSPDPLVPPSPVDPGPVGESAARLSLAARAGTLTAVVVPFLGVVAAPFLLWGWGFGWTDFGLLLGMYVLTALGITVGFHRLFTHRSFETNPVVQFVLAVLGSMAVQGSLLKWVGPCTAGTTSTATRRGDPHSPHHHGRGVLGLLRGLLARPHRLGLRARPGRTSTATSRTSARAGRLRVASALFPAVGRPRPGRSRRSWAGVLTGTWAGVWTGLVWGGLVRVFLVHHVTWSVNSACHLWGLRPYRSDDQSRNNFVFGVLALGEGWHNTHHAFPTSARHGLRWWQIDVSYYVIRLLALLGLAWKVRLPGPADSRGAGGRAVQ